MFIVIYSLCTSDTLYHFAGKAGKQLLLTQDEFLYTLSKTSILFFSDFVQRFEQFKLLESQRLTSNFYLNYFIYLLLFSTVRGDHQSVSLAKKIRGIWSKDPDPTFNISHVTKLVHDISQLLQKHDGKSYLFIHNIKSFIF